MDISYYRYYQQPCQCFICEAKVSGQQMIEITCHTCSVKLEWCHSCGESPNLHKKLQSWFYKGPNRNRVDMDIPVTIGPSLFDPVTKHYCSLKCLGICRVCRESSSRPDKTPFVNGVCRPCRLQMDSKSCDICRIKDRELTACKSCRRQVCTDSCLVNKRESQRECGVCAKRGNIVLCDDCPRVFKHVFHGRCACSNVGLQFSGSDIYTGHTAYSAHCIDHAVYRHACDIHIHRSSNACPNCFPNPSQSHISSSRDGYVCSQHRVLCDCGRMAGCSRCVARRPDSIAHCSACQDLILGALDPCFPRDLQHLLYATLFVIAKATTDKDK